MFVCCSCVFSCLTLLVTACTVVACVGSLMLTGQWDSLSHIFDEEEATTDTVQVEGGVCVCVCEIEGEGVGVRGRDGVVE